MPRIRSIKPEFWSDAKIAELDIFTRLVYIGLWNFADDEGRARAKTKEINGFLFPHDDEIENRQIEECLQKLASTGRLLLYEAEGQRYYQIVHWQTHQAPKHPTRSRLPAPEGWTDKHTDYERKPTGEADRNSRNGTGELVPVQDGNSYPLGIRNQEAGIRNQELGGRRQELGAREAGNVPPPEDLPARPPSVINDASALPPLSLREEVRSMLTESETADLLRGWTEAEIIEGVRILRERQRDGKPPPKNPKGYLHASILPEVRDGKRAKPPPRARSPEPTEDLGEFQRQKAAELAALRARLEQKGIVHELPPLPS